MLTDFRCRKCMLIATLEALEQEQGKMAGYSDEEKAEHAGKIQVLKDALRYNVEAPLVSALMMIRRMIFINHDHQIAWYSLGESYNHVMHHQADHVCQSTQIIMFPLVTISVSSFWHCTKEPLHCEIP